MLLNRYQLCRMRRFLLGVAALAFATRTGCATGPNTRPMPDDPWGDDPHASVSLSSVFSSGTASMAEGVALLEGLLGRDSRMWKHFSSLLPWLGYKSAGHTEG
jgi:hypothetical protein